MAEKVRTVIKQWEFTEEDRTLVVLSDTTKIRLDAKLNSIILKADADGKFPLSANLNVRTQLTNPKAIRKLVGFQAKVLHARSAGVEITGAGYRIHDGTNQWYHNGIAWVISTTLWNTEAQLAANIATYNVKATRTFAFVVNLTTTDATVSPELKYIKVAGEYKIDFNEDAVYRTVVRSLRENVRPLFDFTTKIAFPGGLSITFGDGTNGKIRIDYNPNIVGVDSVFDIDADPDRLADLLSSYDVPTKTITLSSGIPVGHHAAIVLIVQPEVGAEATNSDFVEVEKTPALMITAIDTTASSTLPNGQHTTNKATETAIEVPAPFRENLRFTMLGHAPGGVNCERLKTALVEYMESNPTVRSPGLDESYRMLLVDEPSSRTIPSANNLHAFSVRFDVMDVLVFAKPARTGADGVYPVTQVNVDLEG